MMAKLQTVARRGLRTSFLAWGRTSIADVLLFFAALLLKLLLFNAMLHVRNMATMPDDLFVAVGTLALLTCWTFLLPPRGRVLALVMLNLILTGILYADLIYYRYFQDLISVPVLLQAGQVESLGGSIKSLLELRDLLYFADWLIVVPLGVRAFFGKRRDGLRRPGSRSRLHTWLIRSSVSLIVLATGMAFVFVPVTLANKTWAQGVFVGNWWNVSLYNVTGLYGFHGYDLYRYVKEDVLNDKSLPQSESAEALDWFRERGKLRESLEQDPLFGAYKGKNVIMVQAEAFQNFMIGRSVGGQEVTPNLNKLIGSSLYYDNFYHQTAQGRTSDADFGAQCSLQPMMTGSVFIRHAGHQFDCTPSALKDAGYTTGAFHGYDGGFWNRNAMYAAMRYDHFYSKKAFELDEPLGWSLGDGSFFRQSAELIAQQPQPFYSFLITLTSHHPFTLPKERQTLQLGSLQGTIFGDYLQAVHYTDSAVGGFIEALKAKGLWDDSIFLFYGDHDNSIRDWAPFEQFLGEPIGDLDRTRMRQQVPFIVHLPDERLKGTRSEPGGQLDISPTIRHLLGISSAGAVMAGTPLVMERPLPGKTVVFRSGAYTDGEWYYVPSGAAGGGCFVTATGKAADAEQCRAGADEARRELTMSDRVVDFDLIRPGAGMEAAAAKE